MLPARHRLRRSGDFATALSTGLRSARRTLVVHLVPPLCDSSEPAVTRVGLVVGRGVGNSVVRHRVSRRLRALLSVRIETLDAGSTVVVRAFPAAADASSDVLGSDLDAALQRACRRAERAGPEPGRH
ncbi:MAG: ribonuclease P protein component [bacterium]